MVMYVDPRAASLYTPDLEELDKQEYLFEQDRLQALLSAQEEAAGQAEKLSPYMNLLRPTSGGDDVTYLRDLGRQVGLENALRGKFGGDVAGNLGKAKLNEITATQKFLNQRQASRGAHQQSRRNLASALMRNIGMGSYLAGSAVQKAIPRKGAGTGPAPEDGFPNINMLPGGEVSNPYLETSWQPAPTLSQQYGVSLGPRPNPLGLTLGSDYSSELASLYPEY